MPKKILSLVLSALLLNLCGASRLLAATQDKRDGDALTTKKIASGQESDDAKSVEKVKRKVAEIGTAKGEFVEVKLRDGSKKIGYISEIADDHFRLTDNKSSTATKIAYADVKQIRRTRITSKTINVLGFISAALLGALLIATVHAASRE
ncbi:MAG: hypothetical protein QOE33_1228 [Acidobacteriota bacterium]|nr:hypothetical protein [Acidobacteriota bacterium]